MADEENQQPPYDTGSEPVFDFYCELCREDEKLLEAEGYCVDCGEYLCSTCYTHHRRGRPTRHHVLMDKDNMPKDTPLSYDRVSKDISKKCDLHTGKPVEYYCKSHDFLGCNLCFIEDHRNCSNIESITKVAETIMESQVLKSFIEMLNQFDQRSRSIIQLVKDNISKSQNWCSEVANSVRKFREETNSLLNELEKGLLTQAEDLQKEEEQKLMNISDIVTTSRQSVEKIFMEFEDLRNTKKVCEIFIKLNESKRETTAIKAQLDKAAKENVVHEYSFHPNTNLKEYLINQTGLGKLSAQTSATTVAVTLPYHNPASTNDFVIASPHYNPVNTKATHTTDIEVKSSKDKKNGSITGSAVVSNNRLIIVDCDNRKVKLIDTQSNKVISELKMSGGPWGVTAIGRNQTAVTLWNGKIVLLSGSDTLALGREIAVGDQCRGVAYSKDRLVVTYPGLGKLEIMDICGTVIKTVQFDSDGNKLFSWPQYVCISKDEEDIYVSDCNSNKVTSLTFDGVVKSVYRNSELIGPEKVCVDHHGNVYVCGFNSRNVHMLTADLIKIQIILTQADGLDSDVSSISHCQETNRLYLGMCTNRVKVYQLSQ